MSNPEQPRIGLNYGPSFDAESLNKASWGRGDLFVALDERGADIVVTTGQDSFDLETGLVREALRPTEISIGGISVVEAGAIDLDTIGAFRTSAAQLDLRSRVPLINEPTIRNFSPEKGANPAFASTPLPSEIKGYTADHQAMLDVLSQGDRPRALRMYWFYDALNPQDSQWFPVVRAGEAGTDTVGKGSDWIFVDPESMPEAVVNRTRSVMADMARFTGVREIHAGIDLSYGVQPGETDPSWDVKAVNTREPIFPRRQGEDLVVKSEVAARLNGMLADQLIRMATQGEEAK